MEDIVSLRTLSDVARKDDKFNMFSTFRLIEADIPSWCRGVVGYHVSLTH